MQVFVNVYIFQGIVDDVRVFTDKKRSENDYKIKTEITEEEMYDGDYDYHNLNGSKTFEITLEAVPKVKFETALNCIMTAIKELQEWNERSEIAQELQEIHEQLCKETT